MEALLAIAVLACPVGMGLMMWFMARGMRGDREPSDPSVGDLRIEHERLGRQIEELEELEDTPAAPPVEVTR